MRPRDSAGAGLRAGGLIVLATANPHKVAELRAIFAAVGLSVVGLSEVVSERIDEPEETGRTFEENARIKAMAYAAATGRVCVADDSGLEVDALGGEPGVSSSHYHERGPLHPAAIEDRSARDRANNALLMHNLEGVADEVRTARFVCVMCAAVASRDGAQVIAVARGTFEGRIGCPPRVPAGGNGFGYDPLFLVGPGFERTSAELSAPEKNALSHRGAAARRIATELRALLGE